ncbi:uncharacterized mitochondrial protein-like protein [Tanacetum coccineum]
MSFDDLHKNFKIVEQEVKETASSSSSSSSQNMAFVSSPSNTNDVNIVYGVSTATTQVSPASTQVSTASTQVSTANLSDDTIYAFLASQPYRSQLVYEDLEQIHEDDIEEMDLKSGGAELVMISPTVEYFNKVECFNCHKMGHFARECRGPRNQDSRNRNQDTSRRTINVEETSSKAMVAIDGAGLFSPPNLDLSNSGLEEFQQPEFEGYGPKSSKNVSEDTSNEVRKSPDALMVEKLVSDDKIEKKTIFPTIAKIEFVRAKQQEKRKLANCNYHQKERVVSWNNYTRVNYNYSTKKAHPSAYRNMAPRAVLMKTGLRPLNNARPVNTAHSKTTVYCARPMSRFSKSAQSTVKRPYRIRTKLTNKNFSQKVNIAKGSFYTARPKAVNTARPNSAIVNVVRANQGTCPIFKTLRNLMEDMLPLGEKPKEGKLLMCDKKNSVLFIDTGCFVVSPDFKLADESQVLLKVFRKNNMYNVDMKNIVPKESLTCLVAKATLDESMLWHRRLGHVNFKTINKLVKENLVRGLPTKRFENDQTCVACLKGKATQSSFVTDDYSRFTWVFFLATKDETSGILKSFITEIENLVDKKVKIIRCDNGTEFKNRVMSEFCEKKGIKREFSVARTPQQNGVAERRNRTLIEAARTMLADSKLPTTFWVEAVNTACYVQNRVLVVKPHNKTPYELFRGRTPALSFMRPFGKAFRVYNIRTRKVEENLHIRFLEDKPIIAGDGPKWLFDIDSSVLTRKMTKTTNEQGFISAVYKGKTHEDLHTCLFACFLSQVEPKMVTQALTDPSWIEAMNKKDERDIVVRNKARLQLGFEDPEFSDRVYKVEKALYGLHQAHRAWNETLSTYLLDNGFQRG